MPDAVFSTGLQQRLLAGIVLGTKKILTDTLSFTTNQMLDPGKLGSFKTGDFVWIQFGVNDGVYARVMSGDADQLTFAAGTFTAAPSGTDLFVATVKSGSLAEAMRNGVLHVYGSPRRAAPNDSEGLANLLSVLTLNGNNFTPGEPTNGFNMKLSGVYLAKAVDPATGVEEVVKGIGLADGTASWGCWYDNDRVQGESTSAIRLDGSVSTSAAATFTINSQTIRAGDPVFLKSINIGSGNR